MCKMFIVAKRHYAIYTNRWAQEKIKPQLDVENIFPDGTEKISKRSRGRRYLEQE
jgi:hypothetical protein